MPIPVVASVVAVAGESGQARWNFTAAISNVGASVTGLQIQYLGNWLTGGQVVSSGLTHLVLNYYVALAGGASWRVLPPVVGFTVPGAIPAAQQGTLPP